MVASTVCISDELPVGTLLHSNFEIQKTLGRGAFGITYLALDKSLERLVAIKEYLPSSFARRNQESTVHPLTADDSEMFDYGLASFLDEARTVVKFDHANIVRVFAFFEANNTAYFVMEYVEGQDLKAYLKANPSLSEQQLLAIFSPINEGLAKIHQLGYIHRDIKPGNIYIRADGTPVLLDFGAARDIFNKRVDSLTRILTRGFAPYEQDNPAWEDQGSWTDIYAMGASLYHAIAGDAPVSSQERAAFCLTGKPDTYKSLLLRFEGQYSTHFLSAIDHALQFHPKDRPQDITVWNQELQGANQPVAVSDETEIQLDAEPVAEQVPPADIVQPVIEQQVAAPVAQSVSTSRLPWLIGGMVVVAAVLGGVFLLQQPIPDSQPTNPTTVTLEQSSTHEMTDTGTAQQPTDDAVQVAAITTQTDKEIHTATPIQPETAEVAVVNAQVLQATLSNTLLHIRDAVKAYGSLTTKETLIDKLSSSGSTQTKFIASLKMDVNALHAGFDNSLQQYSQNIQQVQQFPEAETQAMLSQILQDSYQDKPLYSVFAELIVKHAFLNTDEQTWREDLILQAEKFTQNSAGS